MGLGFALLRHHLPGRSFLEGLGAWGLGFGFYGLGFKVWGLGFGVWGLGVGGLGFRV